MTKQVTNILCKHTNTCIYNTSKYIFSKCEKCRVHNVLCVCVCASDVEIFGKCDFGFGEFTDFAGETFRASSKLSNPEIGRGPSDDPDVGTDFEGDLFV